MKRKFKLPFIPTLSVVIFLAAALLWWVNPARVLAGFQVLPVSLRSPLSADYSVDPRYGRIKPLQLNIIEESIRDRQAVANVERIIVELSSPVPTITPMLGSNPNNPPVLPTLVISMTPTFQPTTAVSSVSPTITSTYTPTVTLTYTPTGTATILYTATRTSPVSTQRPTNTSVSFTNTPGSRTNTPRPPTLTSVPPTNTPIPPTNTSIPLTNTPMPPTATNAYPAPPTRTPTPGPTAAYP